MTQDTRKDRRVKIVSLNVRYKSATVDEFIENHAHDVSRGGIYIKTSNPFPQGTLLKFEIRLSSDQTVITGVGRVVWKREAAQGEQPAGMGVKFIKVDDSSKVVIDRLVTTKSDAGKAFESEPDATAIPRSSSSPEPLSSPPPSSKRKVTPYKLAAPPLPGGGPPSSRSGSSPSAGSIAPRPVAPSPLFPKASAAPPGVPKQEQTVMKQAAELLEEALREAGGSMEEVGTNPLFSGSAEAPAPAENAPRPAAGPGASKAPPSPPAHASKSPATGEGAAARGMVAALAPGHSASAKSSVGDAPRKGVGSSVPAPKKRSSMGLILAGVAVVVIAVVALNRDKLFGSPQEPAPQAVAPPPAPPTPPSAAPAVEAPPPSASAVEVPSPEPSSPPAPSASASSAPSSKPSAESPPAQVTKPATPAPAPPPKPTAQAPSAPSTATAAPAASAPPPAATASAQAAPKPTAAPAKPAKPVKSDNDNPY